MSITFRFPKKKAATAMLVPEPQEQVDEFEAGEPEPVAEEPELDVLKKLSPMHRQLFTFKTKKAPDAPR